MDAMTDILVTARERMAEAYEAELPNRDRALSDLKFMVGEQWPDEVRREREAEGKPCLTINALPQYVRQVTGQIRSVNPAIKISPGDQAASKDVADVYEGLIRYIENRCDASSVYEGAAENAAQSGIGWFRVRTDYSDDMSFDQEILIERIHNPFAVFCDPLARETHRGDARYLFIAEQVGLADFKARYPDASPFDITADNRPVGYEYWGSVDAVTVAEYYWIEHDEVEIGLTPDGQVIENPRPPMQFTKKRTVKRPRVQWAKIAANDVLEGPLEVPARSIPVFAVTGEEIHLGEELYRSSVVRFAKDPQVLYNLARSTQAEVIAVQPRAPYMVTPKQIQGLETFWAEANNANRPYLPYNPDEKAPAPQRVPPPIPSQALLSEVQLASEDMKRTTGIYDAALGARSNETSGVAIEQRKQEAQNSTSIYADNMVKAIAQCGRVIVDMIPRVYDTQRVVTILAADDTEKQTVINAVMQSQDGLIMVNNLAQGKYAVRVAVGPAYQTLKQEASEGMMEFLRVFPQAAMVTGDLVAKAQEWPDSEQFAERLKKALPPGIADDEGQQQDPQAAAMAQQQQAAQMQMQQAQMQMAMQAEQAKVRQEMAQAEEAEADALKARYEAEKARMQLAMMAGGLMPIQQPQPGAI